MHTTLGLRFPYRRLEIQEQSIKTKQAYQSGLGDVDQYHTGLVCEELDIQGLELVQLVHGAELDIGGVQGKAYPVRYLV